MKKAREGYKMTELGEIPEDWYIKGLEEVTDKITDGSHFSPIGIGNSDYKICTVANMNNTKLDLNTSISISKEDYEKLIKNGCRPELNDVLLSKDGTVGKTLVFNQVNDNIVLLSSIAIIRPIKNVLDSVYLKYYFNNPVTMQDLIKIKTGSAIKKYKIVKDCTSCL